MCLGDSDCVRDTIATLRNSKNDNLSASQLETSDGKGANEESPADGESGRSNKAQQNAQQQVPQPVGTEHQSVSSGKTMVSSSGAAESAAVDVELAIVVGAWPLLTAHSRSIVLGIARKSAVRNQSELPDSKSD